MWVNGFALNAIVYLCKRGFSMKRTELALKSDVLPGDTLLGNVG